MPKLAKAGTPGIYRRRRTMWPRSLRLLLRTILERMGYA
jgi:hypothetical protein